VCGARLYVQNTAARIICKVRKFDHITPTLIKLLWLPALETTDLNVFKCVGHGSETLQRTNKTKRTPCVSIAPCTLAQKPRVSSARVCVKKSLLSVLAITHDKNPSVLASHLYFCNVAI
jgi:hypothetical protein